MMGISMGNRADMESAHRILMIPWMWIGMGDLFQDVFFDFGDQVDPGDTQDFGGIGFVVFGVFQYLFDMVPFHFLQGFG